MELRHLRYFLAVAETLNISEASRRLRVAQPSLSRQLRDLEFEVGRPLFNRIKGRLSLTAAGEALRKGAGSVVFQVESALAEARQAGSKPQFLLRVGYYGMMWATVVASALRQFRRLFPEIEVTYAELSPAQIVEALKTGDLDLAVLGHGSGDVHRSCVSVKIATVQGLIAVSGENALAKRRLVGLAELRDQTFLSYSPDYAPGRDSSLLQAGRRVGFRPKVLNKARGLPALLLAVAENRGIALVSPFAPRAPHPGVVFTRLRPPGVTFDLFAVYRRSLPPAVRSLAELMVEFSRRDLKASCSRPAAERK